ncbi:MAG: sugar kinase [Sphingobacteriales bacterium 17-39-43]|uniref:ROK family protein n=1 Tax=Daejeonella sp. TaxID=2805397 RepID=UPI000BD1401D|nr:ROK family protein [Daejeonella sp.]OYZ31493.1 MAG: sugar kinase [Sphingobacteriales bacterium 16-39-50]OZA24701.1 MAG: sugar kinase [Sphingobacteriales bacterium 17-39-43]HQT22658.1 ROK family protein [Daejeonella sp.]HQT57652.1 ROK family protein [Daejeonella sp.]
MKSILLEKCYLDSLTNIERKKYLQKVKLVKLLHTEGAKSNADICRVLNISSPTSIILLNELLCEGIIEKKGKGKSIGGRKPELYSLRNNSFYVLCIEMDRFKTEMAILDNNNNNITGIKSFSLKLTKDKSAIKLLHEFAEQLITSSGIDTNKLVGIGLGMPGLVDSNAGRNYTYLVSSSADSKTLQDILEEKFNKPVYVQNDVKTNALAECRFGLALNKKDALVLLMDWGIGLGIIMDGKLQSGMSGFAGEIGHIPFVKDGELCHCGKRGCLETVASGIALARMAKEGIKSGQTSILNTLSEEEIDQIEPQIVIDAANKGDQYAINILSQVGENLGKAVATLIQLFNPELIILGGKIAEAKQYITIPMRHAINTYCMTRIREHTKIVLSTLGHSAGILGSASIVIENTFERQIELASQ